MSELFRIIGVAVVGGIMALTVRRYDPVFGTLTAAAVGICVLISAADMAADTVSGIYAAVADSGLNTGYIKVVMKVIGIAYITQFGAELLRDSGESAVASKCELAGKLFILYLTMPVIGDFLKMCVEIVSL